MRDNNKDLLEEVEKGNLEAVKKLIKNGMDIKAKYGHREIAKYLRDNDALININAKDYYGSATLIRASSIENIEIVKYLLEQGANINAKNNAGDTSLMWASREGYDDIVEYLISKGAK